MCLTWIIASFVLAVGPQWGVASVLGLQNEPDDEPKAFAYVVRANEEGQGNVAVHVVGEAEGGAPAVWVARTEARRDGRSEGNPVQVVARIHDEDAANHGWLGVSIGEVPEAMTTQLNMGDEGTLVLNVVTDSPADQAGLQAHDIILTVGGEKAGKDVGRVAAAIGSRKPGESVDVVVLRKGEEKTFTVELGSRSDARRVEWKFDVAPFAELEESVRTRFHVLQRDDEDNLVLEDLDELQELSELPANIRMFVPQMGSRKLHVTTDGENRSVNMIVERDGRTIEVKQEDAAEIVVRRVDEQGKETTATYADEEELRQADEEAFDLYKRAGDHLIIKLDMDGLPSMADGDFEFNFDWDEWKDVDWDEWKGAVGDWHSSVEESMSEAREAYQGAMEQLHEAIESWKDSPGTAIPQSVEELPQIIEQLRAPQAFFHAGKPKQSFTTDESGRIEVKIRKGDSELVQVFQNEDDLARRNPELYEKYQDLTAGE